MSRIHLYSYDEAIEISTNFIHHVFVRPHTQPPTPSIDPGLSEFIASVLELGYFHSSVAFTALYYLHEFKSRCPDMTAGCGKALFISAFMLAAYALHGSKVVKQRFGFTSKFYSSRELGVMQRAIAKCLDYDLTIDFRTIGNFTRRITRDFKIDSTANHSMVHPEPLRTPESSSIPFPSLDLKELSTHTSSTPAGRVETTTTPSVTAPDLESDSLQTCRCTYCHACEEP